MAASPKRSRRPTRCLHPHGQHWIELPLLGATASVDTRAEFYVNQGGPGNRQMTAFWEEDGYVLELKAAVPDLAAFEERLDWLNKVDSQAWLDAMPAKVVKAADHDAAVREMLKGIPVPRTFKPSQVPDEGLTTARYQVGAAVTGTVSCLWFRQWGEARRTGDSSGGNRSREGHGHFQALADLASDGQGRRIPRSGLGTGAGDAERVPQVRRAQMELLPQAESLGCARWGIPVLPWKQRRQSER